MPSGMYSVRLPFLPHSVGDTPGDHQHRKMQMKSQWEDQDVSEAINQLCLSVLLQGWAGRNLCSRSYGAQDSFSATFLRKLRVGSMTLIKRHVNERLSCLNEDIPVNYTEEYVFVSAAEASSPVARVAGGCAGIMWSIGPTRTPLTNCRWAAAICYIGSVFTIGQLFAAIVAKAIYICPCQLQARRIDGGWLYREALHFLT